MSKVVLLPYQTVWQREFKRLCVHLNKILGDDVLVIRNVGSTSVVGLDSKPILDVDIVLNDIQDLELITRKLERSGYKYRGDLGIPGRYAFGYGSCSLMRHHLYVVDPQAESYLDHISLRDALRSDRRYLEAYAIAKYESAKLNPLDIDAYIEGKGSVIQQIMASPVAIESRRLNLLKHILHRIDEKTFRLELLEGDRTHILRFKLDPFQEINFEGDIAVKNHLLDFAIEIQFGY